MSVTEAKTEQTDIRELSSSELEDVNGALGPIAGWIAQRLVAAAVIKLLQMARD